jgi:Arc/MetJ-type ribon-helix-helix transcriptional regulator
MKRKVVAISMPPKMVNWIQQRVAEDREFTSVSDYIRELVINDRERLKIKTSFGPRFERSVIPGSTYTKRLR